MYQIGQRDDPPATTDTSTPSTRRTRLRQALHSTSDLASSTRLANEEMARRIQRPLPPLPDDEGGRSRRIYSSLAGRRRRREESEVRENDLDRSSTGGAETRRTARYKRRRLSPPSSDTEIEKRKPITYGYYGQVEPGRLKLELVSCDGGVHHDHSNPETFLGAENVLRHDKSVYCSEMGNEAGPVNIVLRHADDTPFCLERLFVVGPEHGFTAPVRDGSLHVAMTLGDLQKYIDKDDHRPIRAQLSPHNPTLPRFRQPGDFGLVLGATASSSGAGDGAWSGSVEPSPAAAERLTLSDALRDPEVNAAFDDRSYPYGLESNISPPTDQHHPCDLPVTHPAHPDYEPTSADLAYADLFDRQVDNAGGIQQAIAIAHSTDLFPLGPEDSSSQEVLDYRLQRLRMTRRRIEAETEERWAGLSRLPREDMPAATTIAGGRTEALNALMARSRLNGRSDAMSIAAGAGASSASGVERERELEHATAVNRAELLRRAEAASFQSLASLTPDPNVTSTAFSIPKGDHKVAINFSPGVSGRFILIKVCAEAVSDGFSRVGARTQQNVDVQSIIAEGFGGGRFFPAAVPR